MYLRVACRQKNYQSGFTLIEAMIVLAIGAILAGMVIPSYMDMMEKNRVKRATEEIFGFINQAKAEAVTRDQDIYVDIYLNAGDWCFGYIPDPDGATVCDCSDDNPVCEVPFAGANVRQVIDNADFPNVTINETFANNSTSFDRVRGSLRNFGDQGTVTVISGDWHLGIRISRNTGRIRVCSPVPGEATQGVGGYPAC